MSAPTNPESTEPVPTRPDPTAELPLAEEHPTAAGGSATGPTVALDADAPPEAPGPAPDAALADDPATDLWAPQPAAAQPRRTGPSTPGIVLGILCLAVAGVVMAEELGRLTVNWGDVGPLGVVATGAVLVVLGIIGLLASRRRESA